MLTRKISGKLIGLLMAGSLLTPSAPALASPLPTPHFTEVSQYQSTTEDLANQLLKYAVFNEHGDIIAFDADKARNENAPSMVIQGAEEFNKSTALLPHHGDLQGAKPGHSTAAWEFYGNWCGPGHSGPGAPIDLLDSRCKEHDLCYAAHGYFNKGCDWTLVSRLTMDIAQGKYRGAVLAKAIAIRAVFTPNSIILPNPVPRKQDIV